MRDHRGLGPEVYSGHSNVRVTAPLRVAKFQDSQRQLRAGADLQPATSPLLPQSAQKG